MIEPLHKQAIIKLINCFTTTSNDSVVSSNHTNYNSNGVASNNIHNNNNVDNNNSIAANNDFQLYKFKDPITLIDLSTLSRLGTIIAMFEKMFSPNTVLLNGSLASLKIAYDSAIVLHLQQLSSVIHFIETNNLFLNFTSDNNNGLEVLQQLQSCQHVHALLVLMREWLIRFYNERNIIYSLFPQLNNNGINGTE